MAWRRGEGPVAPRAGVLDQVHGGSGVAQGRLCPSASLTAAVLFICRLAALRN